MSKFKPTRSQQQALTAHDSDILVSASAGSGKTTILVDRIVKKLIAGQEIDQLLIVTFTDAAAREMKQRLTKRIQNQAAEISPDKRQHLYRQLSLIPSAYISTLHAFCLRVIRKFYYLIDLDPTFRLLSDDNERYLLKERAWQKVRADYYQADDAEFFALEDNFVSGNDDDDMADLIFQLADFALTTPNPNEWLAQLSQQYFIENDVSQTDFYQETLLDTLTNNIAYLKLQVQKTLQYIDAYEQLEGYYDSLAALNEQLKQIQQQLPELLWDDLRRLIVQLPPIKGRAKAKTDPEIMQPFKNLKNSITEQLQELQYKLFALDNQQWQKILQSAGQLVDKLVTVEVKFLKKFKQEKQAQHSLDFNDLEHYTMQILQTQKDGIAVAKEYYQQQFTEILVDEYQDTNPLQEAIVQQIRRNNPANLFMVGDVKQSIYGFRQAAPQLFVHKYQRMQVDSQAGQLINLSENFRSTKNVIDTVNGIFERVMDQHLGDLDYTQDTRLIAGADFPADLDTTTDVILNQAAENSTDTTNEQAEINLIIEKIQQLFADNYQIYDRQSGQKRPLKYSDIVILTRVKSLNNDIVNQFAQAHLPIVVPDAANYFQATEVRVMLSMLKIIDSPRQDIPLVAVLRSMIGGLNENELAYLRINSRTGDYYQALINYLADNSYNQKNEFAHELTTKVQHFMDQLAGFREQAPKISISELIWQIYLQTGYLSYAQGMPNGRQRVANLHALYQRADQFEQMEFKGLFQFIRFIEHIQNNQKDLAQPLEYQQESNEITVMTIHGSKGLEFPIVFLLNIDHRFNNEDSHRKYLFDTQQGIGIKYLDQQTHIIYETLPMYTAKAKQRNKVLSEEIRLLYVALTRAQQKLILVGSTKKSLEEEWNNWQLPNQTDTVIDTAIRSKFNSFQNMLQYVWGLNGQFTEDQVEAKAQSAFQFVINCKSPQKITPDASIANQQPDDSAMNQEITPLFKSTVQKILNFSYPYNVATKTTAYQSVSEIKHLFASPDDQDLPVIDWQQHKPQGNRYILDDFVRPHFLTDEKVAVTPADIGSATHLLLQKIDLKKQPTMGDFQALAHTLVQQQILTAAVAAKINYASLAQFYQSDLGQQILQQQTKLHREWAFSLLLPAKRLFTQMSQEMDDQILIHGIIDGLFRDADNQIIIFDYKTDYLDPQKSSGKHSIPNAVQEYSGQLNLYQQAVEQIAHQKVAHKYLCLLSINQVVEVK
ncbi:helicase-exonuclease AddAB subunit AddA [Bombilactobacillus bombi]|uniref:ATP-dependent helicase/nuclease subunit A n=1 Tax=Bombilactobacillus bombi TaxID=1303590 RepID=A0A3R6ZX89_9LACO|nr:helicase-exonuclease AddAB subunit AddA [Bombilactobacillus bombi]RHW49846.1 helicase-exonuclease AddAB subunit AddA [Bombilactobacillus bombi]